MKKNETPFLNLTKGRSIRSEKTSNHYKSVYFKNNKLNLHFVPKSLVDTFNVSYKAGQKSKKAISVYI